MKEGQPCRWRVRVLGGLSLEPASENADERRRLDLILRRPQTVALLAILVTAGRRGIRRETLLDLLWADGDNAQTRNALAQLLFRTRRALGRGVLNGRETLRVSEQLVSSDIADFWQAIDAGDHAGAVAQYTGALMPGAEASATTAFDRWIATERARLDEAYYGSLERLNAGSPAAPRTGIRRLGRRSSTAAALLALAVLFAGLASSFYVHRRAQYHPQLIIVTPIDNETGDSALDVVCQQATQSIAAVLAQAHVADTVQRNAPGHLSRDAVAVQASLFRLVSDSLGLFVQIVRPLSGRVLTTDKPLVVDIAHKGQLIALARRRVLAYFDANDSGLTGAR